MKFLRVSRERKETRQGDRGPNDRPIPTSAVIPRDKFEVLLSGVCQFTASGYAPGLRIVASSIVSKKKKKKKKRNGRRNARCTSILLLCLPASENTDLFFLLFFSFENKQRPRITGNFCVSSIKSIRSLFSLKAYS